MNIFLGFMFEVENSSSKKSNKVKTGEMAQKLGPNMAPSEELTLSPNIQVS